ncbi:hypothetical protein CDD83_4711 [Cordyceps sp. RAO-2017]|nr:hypothetical protein CDD83_4711 [Cordyceps sp. RAO-2017]
MPREIARLPPPAQTPPSPKVRHRATALNRTLAMPGTQARAISTTGTDTSTPARSARQLTADATGHRYSLRPLPSTSKAEMFSLPPVLQRQASHVAFRGKAKAAAVDNPRGAQNRGDGANKGENADTIISS